VRQELGGLDSRDRVFCQLAEFTALFVGYGGAEVLNLNQPLANENDLGDFRDPRHPGVANKLRIECQESIRFLGIAARRCFPLDEGARSVQLSDRVDVGDEVIVLGNRPRELDLQITVRLANANAVILAESV